MKITNSEQILSNCKWIDKNSLVFELESGLFKRNFKVLLEFDTKNEEKLIRKETIKSIIEFQNLDATELPKIHDAMWNYVRSLRTGQLKTEDNGKTWIPLTMEEHLSHLKIETKEKAIRKCPITEVGFINDSEMDHSFFMIWMQPEWDLEHGLTAFYYNGELDHVGID